MTTGRSAESEDALHVTGVQEDEKVMKLLAEMLAGNIVDLRPQLDFTVEMGFSYPSAEQILETRFVDKQKCIGIDFFQSMQLYICPFCQELNHERPYRIMKENRAVILIQDIEPEADGSFNLPPYGRATLQP